MTANIPLCAHSNKSVHFALRSLTVTSTRSPCVRFASCQFTISCYFTLPGIQAFWCANVCWACASSRKPNKQSCTRANMKGIFVKVLIWLPNSSFQEEEVIASEDKWIPANTHADTQLVKVVVMGKHILYLKFCTVQIRQEASPPIHIQVYFAFVLPTVNFSVCWLWRLSHIVLISLFRIDNSLIRLLLFFLLEWYSVHLYHFYRQITFFTWHSRTSTGVTHNNNSFVLFSLSLKVM